MQFSGQYSGPGSIPGMGIFSRHVQRRSRNMFHSFHNRVLTEDTLGGHSLYLSSSSIHSSLLPSFFSLSTLISSSAPSTHLPSLPFNLSHCFYFILLSPPSLFVFIPSAFTLLLFHHIVPPSPPSHHLLLCNTLTPLIALSPLLLPPSLDILAWRHSVK